MSPANGLSLNDPSAASGPTSDSQVPASGVSPLVPAPAAVSAQSAPKGFWSRFGKAYLDDWHPGPDSGEAPKFRGFPAPISNPPYPFTVWPIGGTVWIGYPNATAYPLTTALQTGPHGDWWKKANIQVYGWLDVGMNVSSSSARRTATYRRPTLRYRIHFRWIKLLCTSNALQIPCRPITLIGDFDLRISTVWTIVSQPQRGTQPTIAQQPQSKWFNR